MDKRDSAPLDAPAIAAVLRDIAAALTISGDSRFRIAAYERGAGALEAFAGNVGEWIADGRFTELPGIGVRLSALIGEIYETGTSQLLQTLTSDLPEGALALARGPKLSLRAMKTLSAANIRDLPSLRLAASSGRLRALRGFTEKTEARILASMNEADARRGRMILRDAQKLCHRLERFLLGDPAQDDLTVDVAGEVRRGLEVVSGVDLLASGSRPEAVLARFGRFPGLKVTARSDAMVSGRLEEGLEVRLHAVAPSARIAALLRLTGSDAHNDAFDRAAGRSGLAVEMTGVYEGTRNSRRLLAIDGEQTLYARARIAYVPPELREPGEAVVDAFGPPPPRLVHASDIRGMVHCHTDYSDGRHTILQMATAAQDRGMQYVTITDHSPTASYANGVDVERLKRQWDEIDRAQAALTIRILRGTESDILKDGALDYPDAILEKLDVIIASIHNRYHLDSASMTERIVRAIRHPMFKIWGHPLGRLLLHRPPVECDFDAILDAAAESRVAIELNGDPHRMDLKPELAKQARRRGLKFVVSVDAHSVRELANVGLGTTMAQRAGLLPSDVLNTLDVARFVAVVQP